MYTVLFSVLFLLVGVIGGFIASEKWTAYLEKNKHEFENLFQENPHPEIFDEEGEINRGTYMAISFDPDFDPDLDGWTIERDE